MENEQLQVVETPAVKPIRYNKLGYRIGNVGRKKGSTKFAIIQRDLKRNSIEGLNSIIKDVNAPSHDRLQAIRILTVNRYLR